MAEEHCTATQVLQESCVRLEVEREKTDSNEGAAEKGSIGRGSGSSTSDGVRNLLPGFLTENTHKRKLASKPVRKCSTKLPGTYCFAAVHMIIHIAYAEQLTGQKYE